MSQELPNNLPECHEVINSMTSNMQALHMSLQFAEEKIKALERKIYGSSSEKSKTLPVQDLLFNEAEVQYAKNEVPEEPKPTVVSEHNREKPKRKPLPENLPRVELRYDLEKKECSSCLSELRKIGEETSEQIDIVPATVQVLKHIRSKYVCDYCEQFVVAKMPEQPIPKSIASPSTLANIITAKYIDALPLYRQEAIFNRLGIEVARGSMSNWVIRVSTLVEGLVELMKQTLLSASYIHADETPVQVLEEKNRAATSKSYMWVAATNEHSDCPQVVIFGYYETRGTVAAQDFLAGFRGYLQVDGYAGYNSVCNNIDVVRLGCWAHVRRKFFEVIENGASTSKSIANEIFVLIKKLYKIEDEITKQNLEARLNRRQIESLTLLNDIKAKVDENIAKIPPKSKLGMALAYTANEWTTLTVFTTDPRLSIDNNLVENAVRPFALGRKNWLFSQSPEGAHASAKIYSLLETAKRNNLNPHTYLKDLLEKIPNIQSKDALHELLPWNWKPPDKT